MMTGHAGIFAGGDMVPADRNVTVAIGHGKKAARHIDAWLRGEYLCRRPNTRSPPSTSSTPGTTLTRRRPCVRCSTSSAVNRPSTKFRADWTRALRCSKPVAACPAATASSATTAMVSARTMPSSSLAPAIASSSTTTTARVAACASPNVPAARSRWSRRTPDGDSFN